MKYLAYIIVFVIVHSSFSPMLNAQKERNNQVEIIAHRGASFDAPENTIASVQMGWEQKADAVEVDVHLSSDQRLMVIHDKDTRRTTGKMLEVAATPSTDLRKLEAGSFKNKKYSGEKIPFLEEVLATVPAGKQLFIEIKCGPEAVPVLKKSLNENVVEGEVVVISFNYEVIEAMEEYLPDIPAYWLIGRMELNGWDEIIDKTRQAGATGLNLHHSLVDENSMQLLGNAEIPVYCWTVDDPNVARKMVKLGVKGITTNRPQWLRLEL